MTASKRDGWCHKMQLINIKEMRLYYWPKISCKEVRMGKGRLGGPGTTHSRETGQAQMSRCKCRKMVTESSTMLLGTDSAITELNKNNNGE